MVVGLLIRGECSLGSGLVVFAFYTVVVLGSISYSVIVVLSVDRVFLGVSWGVNFVFSWLIVDLA